MKGGIYSTKYGYQVRFPIPGTKSGLTKRFKDKISAERFLTGLRFKSDEGTLDIKDYQKDNPLGFSALVNKFIEHKRHLKGVKKYEQRLHFGVDAWGNQNIKNIGYSKIEDLMLLLKDRGLSHKYRYDILCCLKMFWSWLIKRQEINEMPVFPEEKPIMRYRKILTKPQQQQILEKVREITWNFNPRIYIGILFLSTYINIRPAELRGVKEKHIDFNNQRILIVNSKEGPEKYIYLLDDDAKLLRSVPRGFGELYFFRHEKGNGTAKPGNQFGRDYLQRWWNKACELIGIRGVSLYPGTRHTTAVALRSSESPEAIKRGMGTRSNKAFERYLQVTGNELRSIYSKGRRLIMDDNKLIRISNEILRNK